MNIFGANDNIICLSHHMKKQNNETHNQNENRYLYVTSEMTEIS